MSLLSQVLDRLTSAGFVVDDAFSESSVRVQVVDHFTVLLTARGEDLVEVAIQVAGDEGVPRPVSLAAEADAVLTLVADQRRLLLSVLLLMEAGAYLAEKGVEFVEGEDDAFSATAAVGGRSMLCALIAPSADGPGLELSILVDMVDEEAYEEARERLEEGIDKGEIPEEELYELEALESAGEERIDLGRHDSMTVIRRVLDTALDRVEEWEQALVADEARAVRPGPDES